MTQTINREELIDDLAKNLVTPGYWAHAFDMDLAMGERELQGCTTPKDKLLAVIRLLDRVNSTTRSLIRGAIRIDEEMDEDEENNG